MFLNTMQKYRKIHETSNVLGIKYRKIVQKPSSLTQPLTFYPFE